MLSAEAFKGVKMELIDATSPLLKDDVAITDAVEVCKGVNIAVMVDEFPRKEGMKRKDVLSKNVLIYKAQAFALGQHAFLQNITCLTSLDHNRALGQVSESLNVHVGDVKNVTIWGNHSSTRCLDVNHTTVKINVGEKPVREKFPDDQWLG